MQLCLPNNVFSAHSVIRMILVTYQSAALLFILQMMEFPVSWGNNPFYRTPQRSSGLLLFWIQCLPQFNSTCRLDLFPPPRDFNGCYVPSSRWRSAWKGSGLLHQPMSPSVFTQFHLFCQPFSITAPWSFLSPYLRAHPHYPLPPAWIAGVTWHAVGAFT